LDALRGKLAALRASGVEAVAVVLMHAYTYRQHEEAVAALAREVGFAQVTTSSSTLPMVKLVPRGYTATADAYLTPHIKAYLASFVAGFDDDISKVEISFMQSDGGLAPADSFCGFRAVLSGPAGGYIGYAKTAHTPGGPPVIGFDMGGTSTDVSRYAGSVEQVFEARLAGVTIQAPQLDIKTVAAGGGSRFFFREGRLAVGPQSVRAHPGPVLRRAGRARASAFFLSTPDAFSLLGLLPQGRPAGDHRRQPPPRPHPAGALPAHLRPGRGPAARRRGHACSRDLAEIWPRSGRALAELWPRSGRDLAEIWRTRASRSSSRASRPRALRGSLLIARLPPLLFQARAPPSRRC